MNATLDDPLSPIEAAQRGLNDRLQTGAFSSLGAALRRLKRLAWLQPRLTAGRPRGDDASPWLDAATLRDLALDRSELASCLAEARREAQATRRRIAVLSGTRGGS